MLRLGVKKYGFGFEIANLPIFRASVDLFNAFAKRLIKGYPRTDSWQNTWPFGFGWVGMCYFSPNSK